MQHFDAFVFIFELMNDISLWIAIQPHIMHTALKITKSSDSWTDYLVPDGVAGRLLGSISDFGGMGLGRAILVKFA